MTEQRALEDNRVDTTISYWDDACEYLRNASLLRSADILEALGGKLELNGPQCKQVRSINAFLFREIYILSFFGGGKTGYEKSHVSFSQIMYLL